MSAEREDATGRALSEAAYAEIATALIAEVERDHTEAEARCAEEESA
jgi:hypothetical protein